MAKRILIADDSATIQRAFAMTFGAEDVTLVAARSADEAINLARQIQPELVIADGMMPGRSGYDLCATIKTEADLTGTAVYILASAQQPYDESRGRQCGADGHFVKPFDTTLLIERVHDALVKGPTEKAQPPGAPALPLDEDYGPPVPYDGRADIPLGVSMPLALAADDDEYGEISVDMAPPPDDEPGAREAEFASAPATPPPGAPPSSLPAAPAPPSSSQSSPSLRPGSLTPPPASPASLFSPLGTPPPAVASPAAASLRPSLIPGMRPGASAPGRPGTPPPARPVGLSPGASGRPPAPVSRTLMGLPAANIPIPGTSRSSAPPLTRPAPAPAASAPPRPAMGSGSGLNPAPTMPPSIGTPSPLFSPAMPVNTTPRPSAVALPPTVSAAVSAAVGTAVDEKIAAISARGPEYEAIARLSREIIEQIVWEVVPELAEVIIREHVERHMRA